MTPREIRAELILRGINQRSIADQLGVSESAVSHVISGRKRSDRIRRAVARALGKPVHRVFPDEVA